jgi:hypothetical protein
MDKIRTLLHAYPRLISDLEFKKEKNWGYRFAQHVWFDLVCDIRFVLVSFAFGCIRMDRNTTCRLAICIPGYEKHSTHVYHVTCDKNWVCNKDTISWMDFYADIDVEIKRASIVTKVYR